MALDALVAAQQHRTRRNHQEEGLSVAVPYPPDGPVTYSQAEERRIQLARQVIEAALDERLPWHQLEHRVANQLRLDPDIKHGSTTVQAALLAAELELEWENVVVYEENYFRRPGQSDDPKPAPPEALREVSEAVWRLGWPNPGRKPSRTIHECFLALGGRYRHCDVYWAMHKHLKGNRLRVVRRNWMLLEDVESVLADPTLTIAEREELEHELERDLVDAYVAWLGRADIRKRRFSNGREADLYDGQRRMIIEAKASRDDVTVAHGMGQAMYYRSLIEFNDADDIAVLLPGRPSEDVVRVLKLQEVTLIYRDGKTFREELP